MAMWPAGPGAWSGASPASTGNGPIARTARWHAPEGAVDGLMRLFRATILLALALLPEAAAAQGYGRGGTPGDFDFYVLALSWSPTFCATGGEDRSPQQCHDG